MVNSIKMLKKAIILEMFYHSSLGTSTSTKA